MLCIEEYTTQSAGSLEELVSVVPLEALRGP